MLQSATRRLLAPRALLLSSVFVSAACSGLVSPDRDAPAVRTSLPRALTSVERQAISASNRFGLELLRDVTTAHPGDNVLLSPLSASIALGMAYAGAVDSTETAMRRVLGWGEEARLAVLSAYRELPALLTTLDDRVDVRLANAMWVHDHVTVHADYVQDMQQLFGADVRSGDFLDATVRDMNDWASAKTNGRVPRVVERLDPVHRVVLMNALYFKGSWRSRFDPARTQPAPFQAAGGMQRSVPMMRQQADSVATFEDAAGTWAELPYGNSAYVMTFVKPRAGTTPSDWLATMPASAFDAATAQLGTVHQRLELHIPRFRFASSYALDASLIGMGMGIAFDDRLANFSRMADLPLYISRVQQDAFVEVNEEGTEAAAVTQVRMGLRSAQPAFVLDRPFLLFIRERLSGTILFAGVVSDPSLVQ